VPTESQPVPDVFGQMVVLDHVSDLQISDDDRVKFGVESMGRLQMEVLALVGNVFMPFGKYSHLFSTLLAAFLSL